jgi:ABC-2 type transport system ATP-binding protein
VTLRSPQQAAQLADRVVTLELGRLLADQPVEEFRRTRLRDEVSVRGPQVSRLADLLAARGARVRHDGGNVISVEGVARTEIGELAFRHGILLHELADQVVEHAAAPGPRPPEPPGATLARATVALGAGETITTQMIVPAASDAEALPVRRSRRISGAFFAAEDD